MKKKFFLILTVTQLWTTLIHGISSLNYLAYKGSEISHSVSFAITNTQNIVTIRTQAKGESLKETTECSLSATKNQLIRLDQHTENNIDKAHFDWTISPKKNTHLLNFEDALKEKKWSEPWNLKENSYPIQALVYLLQTLPLSNTYTYKCWIITPPKEEFPILLKVIDESTLTFEGKPKLCYKVEASINQILGLFLPKSIFWVTVEKPHIALQYQDQRFLYKLRSIK